MSCAEDPMSKIGSAAALVVAVAGLTASPAAAGDVEVKEYEVEKGFEGDRAADLSGIACVPLTTANIAAS
jgi:hypothetical protein